MSLEDWERHMQTDEDVLPEESVWTSSAAHSRDAPLVKMEPEEPHDGGTSFAARVALRLVKKFLLAVWQGILFVLRAPYKGVTNVKIKDGVVQVTPSVVIWWMSFITVGMVSGKLIADAIKGFQFYPWFVASWSLFTLWMMGETFARGLYNYIAKPVWNSSKSVLTKTMAEVAAEDLKKKNNRFKPG